jgi:cyclic beta-1,2-glucan synthetase
MRQERKLTALLCTQRERSRRLRRWHRLPGAGRPTRRRRERLDLRPARVFDAAAPGAAGPAGPAQRRRAGPLRRAGSALTLAPAPASSACSCSAMGRQPGSARSWRRGCGRAGGSACSAVRAALGRLLGATTVRTPDPLFDALVNRWLPYQTVACRLWAKAGFYQAGGATAFATSCRTRWRWPGPRRRCCASRSCAALRASSPKATCSTGGTHPAAPACARISPTTCCGCRTPACTTCATGDARCWTNVVPFIEGAPCPRAPRTYYEHARPSARQVGQRVRTRRACASTAACAWACTACR